MKQIYLVDFIIGNIQCCQVQFDPCPLQAPFLQPSLLFLPLWRQINFKTVFWRHSCFINLGLLLITPILEIIFWSCFFSNLGLLLITPILPPWQSRPSSAQVDFPKLLDHFLQKSFSSISWLWNKLEHLVGDGSSQCHIVINCHA